MNRIIYHGLLIAIDIFFIKKAYAVNDSNSLIFWSILLGISIVVMICNILVIIDEAIDEFKKKNKEEKNDSRANK